MNIQVRSFRQDDAEAFFLAVRESIEHVSTWLPWCHANYSLQDAKAWVRDSIETWGSGMEYRFIIENKDTFEILGSVAINHIITQHKIGHLGYWVRKSALEKALL